MWLYQAKVEYFKPMWPVRKALPNWWQFLREFNSVVINITWFICNNIPKLIQQFIKYYFYLFPTPSIFRQYWTFLPNMTFYSIVRGFHKTFAMDVACEQWWLTPRKDGLCESYWFTSSLSKNKTNNLISNMSHPSAISNKVIHIHSLTWWGGGYKTNGNITQLRLGLDIKLSKLQIFEVFMDYSLSMKHLLSQQPKFML